MIQELAGIDASAKGIVELHARCMEVLGELQSELSRYRDRVEIDPARLRELEERINLLQGLKRKYGSSVAEVIALLPSVALTGTFDVAAESFEPMPRSPFATPEAMAC